MVIVILCALGLHAFLCGWVLDRRLASAHWVSRSPATALIVWQALGFATILSVLAASLLLAHDALEHLLLWLLQVDKGELHLAYAGQWQVPFAWNLTLGAGAVGLIFLTGSIAWCCWTAERKRSAHRNLHGRVLDRTHDDVVIAVAAATTFAYCLPRRRLPRKEARIVVSEEACGRLPAEEMAAVIAHERAHLRGRHHVIATVAHAVSTLTRRLGLLANWGAQTTRLIELAADDSAARDCGRPTVARALLAMSTPHGDGHEASTAGTAQARSWDRDGGPGAGGQRAVLAVGSADMSERIRRLIPAVSSAPRPERTLGIAVSLLVIAAPLVAVVLPGLMVALGAGSR